MNHKLELKLLDRFGDAGGIESVWNILANSVDSYFLSWGWIESWLNSLPADIDLKLAVVCNKQSLVAAFFLGKQQVVRHSIMKNWSYFLNSTGVKQFDQLCIEHNYILISPESLVSINDLLELLPTGWDEFYMPGISIKNFPGNQLNSLASRYSVYFEKTVPSPYVDLDAVRRSSGGYISLLGSNTRQQIRRAYRGYSENGEVQCKIADSLECALAFFEEMVELHQQTWQQRGQPGAFSSEYMKSFHKDLIIKRFAMGEIQLIRTSSGNKTIGCIYNFVWNGCVYFYQSGFNYDSDQRLKPGLLTFHEAINFNVLQGHQSFDFLGGDSKYKNSLATNKNQLAWVRVQKKLVKYKLEETLRSIKRRFQSKCN